MRTRIVITSELVITILLLLTGIYCCLYAGNYYYKIKNVVALEELTAQDCKKGQIVKGNINTFLKKNISTSGKEIYSATSHTFFTNGKAYEFYTVAIAGNKYICIMVSDKQTLGNLEKKTRSNIGSVYFEGEMIPAPFEPNIKWYGGIEGFEESSIIKEYVIKETKVENKTKIIYLGIVLLALFIMKYRSMGGMKSIVIHENIIKTKEDISFYSSYNKENELEIERKRLSRLENKLIRIKRGFIFQCLLLYIGWFITDKNYFLEIKIVGIFLIIAAAKGLWNIFLNTGSRPSNFIARTFSINTVYLAIKKCKDKIHKLEE